MLWESLIAFFPLLLLTRLGKKKPTASSSERHCIWRGRNYISGLEGSQAVFILPSGRGNTYDGNKILYDAARAALW